MLALIINKLLFITLILSILNILRNLFLFILDWSKDEEEKVKIKLTSKSLLLLGLSIAYVISSIFTGIYI
jgi:hypothetical protein